MFKGYLEVGGNEIVNSARTYGYAQTADCRAAWLINPDCSTVADAQAEQPYIYANISFAPWYDADDVGLSSRFLGVYGLRIENLSDSTRTATVTEKTRDGGVVSGYRHGSREVRVQAWLTGAGEDALEYGMTWLRNALEPGACGMHGGSCGEADASLFVSCPPLRHGTYVPDLPGGYGYGPYGEDDYGFGPPPTSVEELEPDDEYYPRVDVYRRFLHGVRCVSGPFTVEDRKSSDGVHYGRLVEFSLVAQVPFMFGVPKELEVPPLVPTVVQDIAYNLAPYPSAELSSGTVIVATNHMPNPSVETNATGYSTVVNLDFSSPDPTSMVTSGRSDDIAAEGDWSYRTRLDASSYADGWGGVAVLDVYTPTADLTSLAADTRISFTLWAASINLIGIGSPQDMSAVAEWVGVGGTVPLDGGTVDYDGTVFSEKSVPIPAGATGVKIHVQFVLQWYSEDPGGGVAPTDARMYVDAVAVTVP